MKTVPSVLAGFVPFFAMFYLIYESYAKHTPDGLTAVLYFAVIGAVWRGCVDVVQMEERVLQHSGFVREEFLRPFPCLSSIIRKTLNDVTRHMCSI